MAHDIMSAISHGVQISWVQLLLLNQLLKILHLYIKYQSPLNNHLHYPIIYEK